MLEHRGENDDIFPGKAQGQGSLHPEGAWAAGDLEVRDVLETLETSRPQRPWAVWVKMVAQAQKDPYDFGIMLCGEVSNELKPESHLSLNF